MSGGQDGPAVGRAVAPSPGTVTVGTATISDVVGSQIVVGNGNIAIQLTVDDRSELRPDSGPRRRTARELQRLHVRPRPEPVGRDELVARAAADLAEGRNVQLFGAPGVGRLAVAHAVAARLGALGHRGVQLLDAEEPATLAALLSRLAWHFFDEAWYEPDESQLRAAARDAGVSGIVVIADCDLTPAEIERLLDVFPRCAFLLTSSQQTLYAGSGTALEVDPLTLAQARELLVRELSADPAHPVNLRPSQLNEAHRLAEGQTQRLVEYASFLRSAARNPGRSPHQRAAISDQVTLLISGLTEPSRRVLAALARFAVALPPELFTPLAGLDASSAAAELTAAGLIAARGEVYTAVPDAISVLTGTAIDPALVADGLLAHLSDLAGQMQPTAMAPQLPRLCLEVARTLRDAGSSDKASALIRAAAPRALAAGKVDAWIRLVGLGIQCATAADRPTDLAYFLSEHHTGALLRNDRAAAASALAALAELLTRQAALEAAGREAADTARRGLLHRARRLAGLGHGAVGGTLAVLLVVAVAISVIVFRPASAATAAPASDSTPTPSSTQSGAQSAALPAAAAADPAATPGTVCGQLPEIVAGLDNLVVTSGGISCATAYSVVEAYAAVPGKRGATQAATVQGWRCSQADDEAYSETGVVLTCQNGDLSFEAQNPQLAPTAPATIPAQN
ncbi:MAG TPA: hypothetical protein VGX23_03475 [Actinocrinis sp.]|nr:hypothetical protein [Actinocrinis sp.]